MNALAGLLAAFNQSTNQSGRRTHRSGSETSHTGDAEICPLAFYAHSQTHYGRRSSCRSLLPSVCDRPSLAHYYANMHSRQIFTERRVFFKNTFIYPKAACGNLKEIFIFRDFECVSSHFVHHVAAVANTDRDSVVRSAQHLH